MITLKKLYEIGADGTTFTKNGRINVFDPQPEDINIEDIAWALSYHATRWFGNGRCFFPVSQHCCAAYDMAMPRSRMAALLHDASEAYLLDLPKPIKEFLPDYKKVEHKLMLAIAEKFGFEYPLAPDVKKIDEILLGDEFITHIQFGVKHIWDPEFSRNQFLNRYNHIK